MRKFKLIKEYPGSPKLGSIIKDTNPNNGAQDAWFSDNWGEVGNKGAFFISKSTCPENYPEFWEEVKEKEYEILKFTYNKWLTFKLNSNGYYYDVAKDAMCFGIRMDDFKEVCIDEVRRLSDGVKFKLGDKVQPNNKSFKGIIEEFKTYNNTILAFLETPDLEENKVWVALELLQHYKEPLFTTEDGYECGLDDVVYGVLPKGTWETRDNIKIHLLFNDELKINHLSPWLYFKTKENRDEYIYENKPEFSRKQIKDRLKNWADRTVIEIILNDLEV